MPKCPFAGCQEEATEAVTGCNHSRRACPLHMDVACRRYQCTCLLKKATERVKAEEEHKRKNKPESGLSREYARMARTRQVGARILANLEGTMAIYVITWVSQDIPVRGVTNRCTHGALRERDIGTEAEEEWELDLPKLRHKLLPRPEEAQSDESDDGCDTSEVDSGTDSEGEEERAGHAWDRAEVNSGVVKAPQSEKTGDNGEKQGGSEEENSGQPAKRCKRAKPKKPGRRAEGEREVEHKKRRAQRRGKVRKGQMEAVGTEQLNDRKRKRPRVASESESDGSRETHGALGTQATQGDPGQGAVHRQEDTGGCGGGCSERGQRQVRVAEGEAVRR